MAQVVTCSGLGPTKSFPGFCPQGIALLRALKRKKRDNWLASDQELYDFKITNPLLELVCSVSREFARFAPNYVTPPDNAVFRIFGESGPTRQRPNRPPAAIWVHKDAHRGMGGACFYFHFTEKEAVVLAGVYAGEPDELNVYRRLLQEQYEEFIKIMCDTRLRLIGGGLQGESLKRMPQGFRANHPAADLVRRKQWYLVAMLDMALLSTDQLLSTLVAYFEAMAPFVEFLNRPFVRKHKTKRNTFSLVGTS